MSQDEFTKLFRYMSENFIAIRQSLDSKSSQEDMNRVLGMLDSVMKRQEVSDDERLVMGFQLNRLDDWTHQLADKIGHKLSA